MIITRFQSIYSLRIIFFLMMQSIFDHKQTYSCGLKSLFLGTGGSCLMRLLGPGKNRISQKSHQPNFFSYVRSNKINSPKNSISQILVIALKNRSNEIRSNEICSNELRMRRELPVCFYFMQRDVKPLRITSRKNPRWPSR